MEGGDRCSILNCILFLILELLWPKDWSVKILKRWLNQFLPIIIIIENTCLGFFFWRKILSWKVCQLSASLTIIRSKGDFGLTITYINLFLKHKYQSFFRISYSKFHFFEKKTKTNRNSFVHYRDRFSSHGNPLDDLSPQW